MRLGCLVASCLLLLMAPAPVGADETATALSYEQSKSSEPAMIAFLRQMPKGGDLHIHAAGEVTTEVLVQSAIKRNLFFDPSDTRFYPTNNIKGTRIPASNFATDEAHIDQYLRGASMRGWNPAQQSGHDHFFAAFDDITTLEGNGNFELDDIIRNAVEENEQYLEIMASIAPAEAYKKLPAVTSITDLGKTLADIRPSLPTFAAASKAFLDARDEHLSRSLGAKQITTGAGDGINIRFICSTSRIQPLESFFQSLAAAFYCMQTDPRIVAINIVAPEDYEVARTNFDKQMEIIHYLHSVFPKGHVTLHAGELTPIISPITVMHSRIRKSIENGDAERIGHGVSIAWENDLSQLFQEMKRRGTAIEVCLTSNATILGVSGDRHPFNFYRKEQIPLCISTDDEGVSRSNLTLEYARAVRAYDISYADLKDLIRNTIEYSFLPGASLYLNHSYSRLHPDFVQLRDPKWAASPSNKKFLAGSQKAVKQLQLERALVEFENLQLHEGH